MNQFPKIPLFVFNDSMFPLTDFPVTNLYKKIFIFRRYPNFSTCVSLFTLDIGKSF